LALEEAGTEAAALAAEGQSDAGPAAAAAAPPRSRLRVLAVPAVLLLSALSCGLALTARQRLAGSQGVEAAAVDATVSMVKLAGVPVYNVDEAKQVSDEGLLDTTHKGSRSAWDIFFPMSYTTAQIGEFCTGLPKGVKCLQKGDPSNGGVPFVDLLATKSELEEVLKDHPGADFAEPDTEMELSDHIGTDKRRLLSWGLDRIDDEKGLDGTYDVAKDAGKGVHVYVMDTGIRTTHSDFGGRAIPTIDMTSGSLRVCRAMDTSCADDENGHGTHCAGTIGGKDHGVAKGATLHAVKVLGKKGQWSWFTGALDWIARKGKRPAVASASLGSKNRVKGAKITVDAAVRSGVVVVVAAGNSDADACNFSPAYVPNAVTVASSTKTDSRSGFSNWGRCVDIFAPGSLILSAGHSHDAARTFMSGTSMACPHISGAMAVMLGEDPKLTVQQAVNNLLAAASTNNIKDAKTTPNRMVYTGGFPENKVHHQGPIRWAAHPNKCLDINDGVNKVAAAKRNGKKVDGTNVQIWDCGAKSENPNMQFILPVSGRGPIHWATHPEYCLDVSAGSLRNGANLQIWSCVNLGQHDNMMFVVPKNNRGSIKWAKHPNRCVDIAAGSTRNGNNVQFWNCVDGGEHPNMQFRMHTKL